MRHPALGERVKSASVSEAAANGRTAESVSIVAKAERGSSETGLGGLTHAVSKASKKASAPSRGIPNSACHASRNRCSRTSSTGRRAPSGR